LIERQDNWAALLWDDADKFMATQLQLFVDIVEVLYGVSYNLRPKKIPSDVHPVGIRIVLFGTGPNFPERK
jgi:hypothetical protein